MLIDWIKTAQKYEKMNNNTEIVMDKIVSQFSAYMNIIIYGFSTYRRDIKFLVYSIVILRLNFMNG